MRRSCAALAAGLALALTPGAAAAKPRVVSAYAFFTPAKSRYDKTRIGLLHFVFRTDRALPVNDGGYVKTQINIGYVETVSHTHHCYEVDGEVYRGRDATGPGARLAVRLGHNGSLLRRTFTVQPTRPGYLRGGLLGCTRDPAASYVIFQTEPDPEVQPRRIFFAADSAPYIDKLRWTGWGTDRAVGHGVFIHDCGTCGPEVFRRPSTVVFDRSVACGPWGVRVYGGHLTAYDKPDQPRRIRWSANTVFC